LFPGFWSPAKAQNCLATPATIPSFSDTSDKNFEFPFVPGSVDTQITLGWTMWALRPELEFSARTQAGSLVR
jgi:hypothetical protein